MAAAPDTGRCHAIEPFEHFSVNDGGRLPLFGWNMVELFYLLGAFVSYSVVAYFLVQGLARFDQLLAKCAGGTATKP